MSGHSKWSQIKHKKAAQDQKRGAQFTKMIAAITLAAKQGGGDPSSNFKLRLAIDKAKEANMPSDNIDRAIKKGTGELAGANIEEITLEGFGPHGIAVILEGVTDNKNRTLSNIKSIFNEYGGRLANTGSVAYQFEPKGVISIPKPENQDELELELIDFGAEDFEENDGNLMIYTNPAGFGKVKKTLEDKNIEIISAELSREPRTLTNISDPDSAKKVLDFIESLEADEDILAVYSNFDISEQMLGKLTK